MDPQNSGPDCILYRDLKVLSRQSFQSSSQVPVAACSHLSRPVPYAPSWISSRQSFLGRDNIRFFSIFIMSRQSFLCRDRSFFGSLKICLAKPIILTVICRNNLMCGSLNSYVTTSTIFVVIKFLCSFFKLVSLPVFMSRQHFCFGSCCNNVSCIVRISVATQKVYRYRVLSPLNLISCCSFILMLRHGLLV